MAQSVGTWGERWRAVGGRRAQLSAARAPTPPGERRARAVPAPQGAEAREVARSGTTAGAAGRLPCRCPAAAKLGSMAGGPPRHQPPPLALRGGAPPRPRRVWRRAFPASQPEDWLPRGVRTPIGVKWGLPGGPQASDWTSVPRLQRPRPSHAFRLPAGEPSLPCQVICTFPHPTPMFWKHIENPKTHRSNWRGSATQATPLRISTPG